VSSLSVSPLRFIVFLLVVGFLAVAPAFAVDPLAFPGAEGFGRFASGGRGGDVYVVTNLNDSGPGSLRDAVANRTSTTPRTVVFGVSGTIYLNSTLRITQGNLTIAGQTAPGDGICIARYPIDPSNSSNVIIRFLRSRLGDVAGVENDAFSCRYATNIIIDHCSFSWSVDETFSAYDNTNFTLQWSFITESLRDSVHSKGAHGYGGIWGGLGASFHHNLMAHHDSRNPRFNGARTHGTAGELVDMRNNVIYNWRGNSTYGGEPTDTGLPARHNMVNNFYRHGPATGTGTVRYRILNPSSNALSTGSPYSLFHVFGNHTSASSTVTANNWSGGVQGPTAAQLTAMRVDTPFEAPFVIMQSAAGAYPLVLAHGGCRLPARDPIDTRIANEAATGTVTFYGSKNNYPGIIDSQTDVGGWPALASLSAPADTDADGMPDAWESARGLNPANAADRNVVDAATGYTRLEQYLNELAAPAFPLPVVSTQPASGTHALGSDFTLIVSAAAPADTGSLAYQWYRDEVAIAGATTASYAVAAAAAGDAGSYRVAVSNAYGTVSSAIAVVTISALPPVIVTSPVAVTVAPGQGAVFSVVAGGSPTLSYQWYRGTTVLDGATSATLSLFSVTSADAGDYSVVVTNAYGSATSAAAALSVSAPVGGRIFETNFAQDTIHAAVPVVTATRTNWYIMGNKVATNSNVGDNPATSSVAETRPFTLALNAGSTAANYQAAAVFAPAPLSLAQTGSSLRVTVTLATANNINLGMGLFNSGGSLPHTTHHSGTTAALIGGAEGIDGGVRNWTGYRALLTHGSPAGALLTRIAQTTSEGSITNRTQDLVVPGSSTASYGQPAGVSVGTVTNSTTSVTPVNDAVYTLVLQISRTDADQFTLSCELYDGASTSGSPLFSASGVTSAAAARPSAVTSAFDSFAIGARTTNGSVPRIVMSALAVDYSAPGSDVAPSITTQPQGLTVVQGLNASFSLSASGTPAPTFQWRKNGVPVAGATSSSLSLTGVQTGDAGDYTCVVSNSAGSVESAVATLVVQVPPQISLQPLGQTVVRGSAFTLTAGATGFPSPTFQWYRGGTVIAGATAASYAVVAAAAGDAGSYSVTVSNPAGTATSSAAVVSVLTPYQAWVLDNGLDSAGNGAPAADAAGDGVPNLVKFALGGDPAEPGATALPSLSRAGSTLVFVYDVKTVALLDHVVAAEYSSNLADWSEAVHGSGGVTVSAVTIDAATRRVEVGFSQAAPSVFVRLRVAAKP
jgi:hypothetical protein